MTLGPDESGLVDGIDRLSTPVKERKFSITLILTGGATHTISAPCHKGANTPEERIESILGNYERSLREEEQEGFSRIWAQTVAIRIDKTEIRLNEDLSPARSGLTPAFT